MIAERLGFDEGGVHSLSYRKRGRDQLRPIRAMPLLEAFLALALTMLSFAMVATLLVELGMRVVGTRSRDLRTMLEAYYESELKPLMGQKLEEELNARIDPAVVARLQAKSRKVKKGAVALEQTVITYKEVLLDELRNNPLFFEQESLSFFRKILKPRYFVKPLVELSPEDLFKRLATTEFGKAIKERSELEIDDAVDSMSRAYDKYGNAASDIFKRRSSLVSLAAGLVVALVLNVNALVILKSFLNDPVARGQMVAQAEAITRQYEALQSRPEAQGFENAEEAKALVAEMSSKVDALQDSGIDFGWKPTAAPQRYWNGQDASKDSFLKQAGAFLVWLVGALGTGMLVGLGCPFWFNIVTKITSVLRVVRGGAGAAGKGGLAGQADPDPLKENRDLFKTTGGAPLTMKFRAVERTIKAAAGELFEAEKALKDDPSNVTKNDLVAVCELALAREVHKHRELLKKADFFPVEAFEDPSGWVREERAQGKVEAEDPWDR